MGSEELFIERLDSEDYKLAETIMTEAELSIYTEGSFEGLGNFGATIPYNLNSNVPQEENTMPLPPEPQSQSMHHIVLHPICEEYEVVNEFIPHQPKGPPNRVDFLGHYKFTVTPLIDSNNKCLFSFTQNRIYTKIKEGFPLHFAWERTCSTPMFVRATVVFSEESQAGKRVETCLQHTHDPTNSDLNEVIKKNVLRSSRDFGADCVYYCGPSDVKEVDCWYSVLVRFDESQPCGGTHAFQFGCKNSCSSGINRRSIDIIFTLEDSHGEVLGRQTMGARVCACPKRDKAKDEENDPVVKNLHKRRLDQKIPITKKIKLENDEDSDLVTLQIQVHPRVAMTGLLVMLRNSEDIANRIQNNPKALEEMNKSIESIKDCITKLDKPIVSH